MQTLGTGKERPQRWATERPLFLPSWEYSSPYSPHLFSYVLRLFSYALHYILRPISLFSLLIQYIKIAWGSQHASRLEWIAPFRHTALTYLTLVSLHLFSLSSAFILFQLLCSVSNVTFWITFKVIEILKIMTRNEDVLRDPHIINSTNLVFEMYLSIFCFLFFSHLSFCPFYLLWLLRKWIATLICRTNPITPMTDSFWSMSILSLSLTFPLPICPFHS